jgi:hypothetical protein
VKIENTQKKQKARKIKAKKKRKIKTKKKLQN